MEEEVNQIAEAQDNDKAELKTHLYAISNLPKLTKRNKRFCELYNDFTNFETFGQGKKSAIEAGYPEEYAAGIAWKLLQKPQIQSYLSALDQEIKLKTEFSRVDALHLGVTLLNKCPTWAVKARFYELVCKIKGYVDSDDKTITNVSLFQQLDGKIDKRLQVIETKDVNDNKILAVNPPTLHNVEQEKPLVADNLT